MTRSKKPALHHSAPYQDEARARWGHTRAWAESRERTKRYGKADWDAIRLESASIMAAMAEALVTGLPPGAPAVRAIAERHRAHIDRWFYPCSREVHAALGRLYAADARFARHYDEVRPGLAAFMSAALQAP